MDKPAQSGWRNSILPPANAADACTRSRFVMQSSGMVLPSCRRNSMIASEFRAAVPPAPRPYNSIHCLPISSTCWRSNPASPCSVFNGRRSAGRETSRTLVLDQSPVTFNATSDPWDCWPSEHTSDGSYSPFNTALKAGNGTLPCTYFDRGHARLQRRANRPRPFLGRSAGTFINHFRTLNYRHPRPRRIWMAPASGNSVAAVCNCHERPDNE